MPWYLIPFTLALVTGSFLRANEFYPSHVEVGSKRFEEHTMIDVLLGGELVELEDGSQWKIPEDRAHKTWFWRAGDPIAITPTWKWFSSYTYCITNKANGEYVEANLFRGPVTYGPSSHWLIGKDIHSKEEWYNQPVYDENSNIAYTYPVYQTVYSYFLFLEDGSLWKIWSGDSDKFAQWLEKDTIIVGTNDSWWTGNFENILINVNTNTYVRALRKL